MSHAPELINELHSEQLLQVVTAGGGAEKAACDTSKITIGVEMRFIVFSFLVVSRWLVKFYDFRAPEAIHMR
jgi:hypothetical protein